VKKINTHNLPENLRKMQDNAIKQAKDFKSKSTNEKTKKEADKIQNYNLKNSFLSSIFKDKDNALIIILIVLLMVQKKFLQLLVLQ